ncbi:MAG: hypothetical protein HQK77_09300 [Desulfobacterales bacterium]|nr:hypothetical protein [Desulfobacterales bacterium]
MITLDIPHFFCHEMEKISSHYKMDKPLVEKTIQTLLEKHPDVYQLMIQGQAYEEIQRRASYKRFIKAVKKDIYYQLRQYHVHQKESDALQGELKQLVLQEVPWEQMTCLLEQIMSTHISTKERLPFYKTFYHELFQVIDYPESIIDIGCGLHPLSYPFHTHHHLKHYIAIDKDKQVISILNDLAPYLLPLIFKPLCMDLKDIHWENISYTQQKKCDLAFMLKIVPVIQRQNKALVNLLCNVPATWVFITGNIEAMTRKQTIYHREKQLLHEFIRLSGKKMIHTFYFDTEFGYLLG